MSCPICRWSFEPLINNSTEVFLNRPEASRMATDSDDRLARSSDAAPNTQSQFPSISIPKGGGAIQGMGEKFATNPVTGTGSMTVPIPMSSGRGGFGPQLSLSYDSGSGKGPFVLVGRCRFLQLYVKQIKGSPSTLIPKNPTYLWSPVPKILSRCIGKTQMDLGSPVTQNTV